MPIRNPGSCWATAEIVTASLFIVALFLLPNNILGGGTPFSSHPAQVTSAPRAAVALHSCGPVHCHGISSPTVRGFSGLTAWTNLTSTTPNPPPAREGASVVYDTSDGYLLLFGGLAGTGTRHDTWKYQNGSWTNLTPSLVVSPQGRYKAGMVYDSGDGYVLLFGGNGGSSYLNDTWKFQAGVWTKLTPALSPTPREDISMTDDLADGYVLLFGGEPTPPATPRPETWTFSGGVWTNLTGSITVHPSGRETGAMTYDASDGYVLLFGGKHTPNVILQDTWSYLGGVWTNLTSQVGTPPPIRESASVAYDPVDNLVLLFGGLHFPKVYNDTWAYHNLSWSLFPLANAPPSRFDAPLTWSPETGAGHVILFGGRPSPAANASFLRDTWSFKVPLGGAVTATPSVIDTGQSTQLSVTASGGYPPVVAITWNGLPTGCAGSASPLTCAPTGPGVYAISATLNDSLGGSVTTAPVNLTVNLPPQATATATPLVEVALFRFTFNSSVSQGSPPLTYNWSFGDSNYSTAANTTHPYSKPGTYTAQLVVKDATGATATATANSVTVNASLIASATAIPLTGPAPLSVHFSATGTGGLGPYHFAWTFGDAVGVAATAQANYTYPRASTWKAAVTVTDQRGSIATAQVTVTLSAPLSAAILWSISTYYCEGENGFAVLNASAHPTGGLAPYSFTWSLGAGSHTTGPYANQTVMAGNTTLVTVLVADARGVVAQANATATTTSLPCASLSSSPSLIQNPLFWVLLVLLVAVILLEVVMIARRRSKQ